MKIYPEKVWIDVDSKDKPFILHNEATMGMCAYIRSDLAHPEPTGDRVAALAAVHHLAIYCADRSLSPEDSGYYFRLIQTIGDYLANPAPVTEEK